ncbi:MAG: outer membrane lipoprotein carrier protein LolA [Calditrichia bacterium]
MKKFAFLIVVFLFSTAWSAPDAEKIIKNVQKKYKGVDQVLIHFKQINRFKLTGIENEVFGTLWLTRDNKFKIDTEDQTLVSNGDTFWRFNKLENQVLIDNAKNDQQEVFLNDFLFNIGERYYSQVISVDKSGKRDIYEMKLTPRNKDESYFNYLKVWIEDNTWQIKRVLYVDYNDNENEYVIEEMNLKPDIPLANFTYEVPEGADIVDLRY